MGRRSPPDRVANGFIAPYPRSKEQEAVCILAVGNNADFAIFLSTAIWLIQKEIYYISSWAGKENTKMMASCRQAIPCSGLCLAASIRNGG